MMVIMIEQKEEMRRWKKGTSDRQRTRCRHRRGRVEREEESESSTRSENKARVKKGTVRHGLNVVPIVIAVPVACHGPWCSTGLSEIPSEPCPCPRGTCSCWREAGTRTDTAANNGRDTSQSPSDHARDLRALLHEGGQRCCSCGLLLLCSLSPSFSASKQQSTLHRTNVMEGSPAECIRWIKAAPLPSFHSFCASLVWSRFAHFMRADPQCALSL